MVVARPISERWSFGLDNEKISLRDISWSDALPAARETEQGVLAAQSDGECVQCEFNATHAAVLYMGRDEVIYWPYLPDRSAAEQDLTPFFAADAGASGEASSARARGPEPVGEKYDVPFSELGYSPARYGRWPPLVLGGAIAGAVVVNSSVARIGK